jgi:hypothetical protein
MFTAFDRETTVKWIAESPGISDRELAERAYGFLSVEFNVKRICRELANAGMTRRVARPDGAVGNWPTRGEQPHG